MSISLGTAFELDVANLEEAWELLSEFRTEVQALGRAEDAFLHAKQATITIDRAATLSLRAGERPAGIAAPLSAARKDIKKRRRDISTTGYRDPEVDFDFCVSIFPKEGQFFGMVHSERDDWTERLFGRAEVCHAPWWNNVDRPEGISEAAWVRRGKDWEQIFARDPARRPSHCGLTFEMTPFLGTPDISEVISVQEDFDTRLSRMARECLTHEALRKVSGDSMSEIMRVLGKVQDFLCTKRGEEALDDVRSSCRKVMKKSLERGDFLGS